MASEPQIDPDSFKHAVASIRADLRVISEAFLECTLPRRIRPLLRREFNMVRPRIMLPDLRTPAPPEEFIDPILMAEEDGIITNDQVTRVFYTDLIIRGRSALDGRPIWLSVEASTQVTRVDVEKARETADILATVFDEESFAVVAGHSIDPPDLERADAAGVIYLEVEERF